MNKTNKLIIFDDIRKKQKMKNLLLFIISIPLISFSQVNCDTVYVEPEYGRIYSHKNKRILV